MRMVMPWIIYLVNLILSFFIVRYEYYSGSDKTIIISVLLYAGLIGVNLLTGFFAQLSKRAEYRHYYYAALLLVIGGMTLLLIW